MGGGKEGARRDNEEKIISLSYPGQKKAIW